MTESKRLYWWPSTGSRYKDLPLAIQLDGAGATTVVEISLPRSPATKELDPQSWDCRTFAVELGG